MDWTFPDWQVATVGETTNTPTYVYLLYGKPVPFQVWYNTLIVAMAKGMGLMTPTNESEAHDDSETR